MTNILIVEDDISLGMSLENDLKLEGYNVQLARDGETGSQKALSESFDLIVLDVMLPRKDGFEVCRELRRNGLNTPIVMLTACSQDAEKVMGLEMGADDYITKPYNPRELRARIKAVLRRSGRDLQEIYSFGDVEIDFTRHEIRRAGTFIAFTNTEFKLLETLVRNRGRVLTRERLLDEVWGLQSVTDRVVDNQIVNLRKKVETDPSNPCYLITIPGVGYRFDD